MMKNKKIIKKKELELKRDLIIWMCSWAMLYAITSLWELIWMFFEWKLNNDINLAIIIFVIKIFVVMVWFKRWIKYIQRSNLY